LPCPNLDHQFLREELALQRG